MAADEDKVFADVLSVLLSLPMDFHPIFDSKILSDSISTCQEPHDRSIRPHRALLRNDFERRFIDVRRGLSIEEGTQEENERTVRLRRESATLRGQDQGPRVRVLWTGDPGYESSPGPPLPQCC